MTPLEHHNPQGPGVAGQFGERVNPTLLRRSVLVRRIDREAAVPTLAVKRTWALAIEGFNAQPQGAIAKPPAIKAHRRT